MTTDLEKEFFDTFGIEPKRGVELTIDPTTDDNVMNEHYVCYGYPQITDRILLELICMLSKTLTYVMLAYNIDELKQYVLSSCIRYSESIDKQQVKELFEEG